MRNISGIFLILLGSVLLAQSGEIRGVVHSEANGEKLMGISLLVNEEYATMTDLDGTYSYELEPGNYTLTFEDYNYEIITVENIEVKAGEVTVVPDVFLPALANSLGESPIDLSTVVVTGTVNRNSEKALIFMKKKSSVMLDGISSAKMELAGDGTAIEAAKRVTGVSIEGGKYVYVRGLGDRYSKTTLNGVDIPGLDPDRNTLQMDIFPTNLLDNIMVSKNFTADLPADFTGGVLNIETKAFPTKKFLNISYGLGVTPGMTFNKDYLYYKGGDLDFLGFDDGTRELPSQANNNNFPTPINSSSSPNEVNNFVGQFNKTLGASRKPAYMNQDFSVSYGDQFSLKNENKLAVIFGLNYKNETVYYDDYSLGEYQRIVEDPSRYELRYATTQEGEAGVNNVLLGALGGISYKTKKSRYSLNAMHLQSGTSKAGKFFIDDNGEAVGQSGFLAASDNLEYNQRSLTNFMLQGVHKSTSGDFELNWKLSPTFTKNTDPDIRKTAFTYEAVDTAFYAGAAGNPTRIWRYLDEFSGVGKLDLSQKYAGKGEIKAGAAYVYKQRDFNILQFNMQFWSPQNWNSYDPNQILDPGNIYPNNPNGIWYASGNADPNPNEFESNSSTIAGYVSNEYEFFGKLKTILGVRVENFVMNYTGANQTEFFDDEEVISSTEFFPTANVIYALTDKMNLRAGYAKTIARPSFKEASFAQIIDPFTDRIFNGGFWGIGSWDGNLTETNINNFDVRWEFFPSGDQIFSVSGFYKTFQRPIELVRIASATTSSEFQPRNVGDGTVYGVELEFKKHLGFISEGLKDLSVSSNVTFVKSEIEMSEDEFSIRKEYEREGENIENTRDMAGQAPYVINAGIEYLNSDFGMQTGLFYNVRGKTLSIVGTGLYPDVYSQPFHSLNYSINKKFGKEQRTQLSFQVSNILDDKVEDLYESYKAQSQIFESKSIGRTFSLSISYDF